MRSCLPWLLLCLTGCYITSASTPERREPGAPRRDPGATPRGSNQGPDSSLGETDPNVAPDPTDAGEGPLEAGIDDPSDSDASTPRGNGTPWRVACGFGSGEFACARADCDARDDVAAPAGDILASRGFIRGNQAVVQVLFAADPFDVEATGGGLDLLFDRDEDPTTGAAANFGDNRVWAFDAWVSVSREEIVVSPDFSAQVALDADLPLLEARVPLSAISDSQTEFRYALISRSGGSFGGSETVPELENTYLTSRSDVPDVALCPERGPYCDGPYEERKAWDGCDAVHPSWTTYEGVESIDQCFQLCADHPLCRSNGVVNYNPQKQSCILDASCSPETVGYEHYVASGGCGAP